MQLKLAMTQRQPRDAVSGGEAQAAGQSPAPTVRPRVAIVGAGFGGLTAAQALAKAPVDIMVIDRRNYHLFQPLLYQVATAALSPADIAWPIRGILGSQKNAAVQLGRVTGVDADRREVVVNARRVPYDFLIIATGARHAYFDHPEWENFAPGLKKIHDAIDIRERVLTAFERAEAEYCEPQERRHLQTFVVVGGGPTGVEMAGAIAELANFALAADFRVIDPATTRVVLVEAGPRLLPAFPEKLSAAAERALRRLGVDVRLGTPVTRCDSSGVWIGDEWIGARTIVWAAGVMASPAARWLGAEADRAGRAKVNPDFSVPGHPEIFVIGDTAAALNDDGRPLPGVAPVAKQAGRYVADVIRRRVEQRPPPAPFHYRDAGNLATIGRKAAVAEFGRIHLTGFLAWVLWCAVHIYFLIGLRNRLVVALAWLWSYLTFQRGARLISSGEFDEPAAASYREKIRTG